MRSVLICVCTYARFNFSKNPTKNNFVIHTYNTKRHLTVNMSSFRNTSQPDETPEPPKNCEMSISDIPNDTPNQHYHNHDVAHAADVKYENNQYITPINVLFGSTESDSTVNIVSKHHKSFTAINILDRSAKIITDGDIVIHHPKRVLHRSRLCNKIHHHQ